jgi:hypothetical protein
MNDVFSMDIDANEIYIVVCQLLKDIKKMNSTDLKEKYAAFEKKFPKVYNACISDPDHDSIKETMSYMLNKREYVKKGEISTFESNVHVGEYMAKKHIYPVVGEPTKNQKSEALHKLMRAEEKKKNGGE